MAETDFCDGVAALAERYDGFLVDQWGVLHDGVRAYPGARPCLDRLMEAGKRVVVISNSGRRSAANAARMARLGIPEAAYTAVVTSGEAAWRLLSERRDPFFASLGRRCYLIGNGGDRSVIEGLDLTVVDPADAVDRADFLLLSGLDAAAIVPDDYAAELAGALARGLPLICANPDIVGITGDVLHATPGALARHYAAMGGRVRTVGKPEREIYDLCLAALGDIPRDRIVAIGDSLQHDVAGAANIGVASALVTAGIHRDAFAGAASPAAIAARLTPLCRQFGVRPDWVLPAFLWRAPDAKGVSKA